MIESLTSEDKLFKEKTGLDRDYASINHMPDANNDITFMLIIEGYKNSLLELINNLSVKKKINWLELDTKIYPILFLFRQYLELIIKQSIRLEKILQKKISSDEVGFEPKHSLLELWGELRPIIESKYSIFDIKKREELKLNDDLIEGLIEEIETFDNGSFAFRYPFENPKRTKGKVKDNLPNMTIDVNNLKKVMEKVIVYFEGINENFRVLLDESQTKN